MEKNLKVLIVFPNLSENSAWKKSYVHTHKDFLVHSDHKCLLSIYYALDIGPEQETSDESNRHGS